MQAMMKIPRAAPKSATLCLREKCVKRAPAK